MNGNKKIVSLFVLIPFSSFILSIFITRGFPVDVRGEQILFIASLFIYSIFGQFFWGGMDSVREVVKENKKTFIVNYFYLSALISAFLMVLLISSSFLEITLFYYPLEIENKILLFIIIILSLFSDALKRINIPLQRYIYIYISALVGNIVFIIILMIFILLGYEKDMTIMIMSILAQQLIIVLILIPYGNENSKIILNLNQKYKLFKSIISVNLRSVVISTAIVLAFKIDTLILSALGTYDEIAITGVSLSIVIQYLVISRYINPIIKSYTSSEEVSKDGIISIAKFLMYLGFILSIILFALGEHLFGIIFGDRYIISGSIAFLFMIAYSFMSYIEVISAYCDIKYKYNRLVGIELLLIIVLSLPMFYYMYFILGVYGISISMIVMYFCMSLVYSKLMTSMYGISIIRLYIISRKDVSTVCNFLKQNILK